MSDWSQQSVKDASDAIKARDSYYADIRTQFGREAATQAWREMESECMGVSGAYVHPRQRDFMARRLVALKATP